MTVGTRRAVRVSGVSGGTLRNLVQANVITPVDPGGGKGKQRQLSIRDLIALTAYGRFARAGAGSERSNAVLLLLTSMSLEQIEAHVSDGRTFVSPGLRVGRKYLPGALEAMPQVADRDLQRRLKQLDLRLIMKHVEQGVRERSVA